MEEVVAELWRQASAMHPSQLALQLDGPMDVIEHLQGEIDEYLGIEKARELLSRAPSRNDRSGSTKRPTTVCRPRSTCAK